MSTSQRSGCRALHCAAWRGGATTLFASAILGAMPGRALAQGAPSPSTPQVLTREQAIDLALSRGPQSVLAGTMARAADAELARAGTVANPTLNTSYSKAVPQYHAIVDLPLDFLTARQTRLATARASGAAARDQLALDQAAIRLEIDTLYTRAIAVAAHATLSERDAIDADSLLAMARTRRDAGDASELDVELARVNAGQADNAAAADSLAHTAAVLDLQTVLGLPTQSVTIALTDSIGSGALDSTAPAGGVELDSTATPLSVAVAEQELRAADRSIALERRSIWNGLSLTAGVENHDPTGVERGLLPTVGVSIPLPLLNQGGGDVAVAEATRDRARAVLELARRENAAAVSQTARAVRGATARAARDRALVASAEHVARMALRAYAEGAYSLAAVLEAQHNARSALAQLIDDTVTAENATAELRYYTTTVVSP
jgi:cobalt-zinc-cadmium efflux system outer membrane protein